MVQRFPELQRVDQGLAVSILFIQLIQAPPGEQERGNPFTIAPEADPAQLTTPAQKKCPSKNIRGLKSVGFQRVSPPSVGHGVAFMRSRVLIFDGSSDRKRQSGSKGILPLVLSRPSTTTCHSHPS
jgi:hypothetical protein